MNKMTRIFLIEEIKLLQQIIRDPIEWEHCFFQKQSKQRPFINEILFSHNSHNYNYNMTIKINDRPKSILKISLVK
jgi:hypothetical protein